MIDSETKDILYRSRLTLLDMLEEAGFDTQPYRKFSHKEIEEMANASSQTVAHSPALQIDVKRRADAPGEGSERCVVIYTLAKIKQKLAGFIDKTLYEETDADLQPAYDFEKTDIIVMTMEPVVSTFHAAAYDLYEKKKIRIRFFQAATLINTPTKHILVPKHEKISVEEKKQILSEFYAKENQLPIIRFHEDPIARVLGLVPFDVVKITRPSATAGECIMYRICLP